MEYVKEMVIPFLLLPFDFCHGGSPRACDCEVSHSGVICTRSEQGVGRTPLGHWASLFMQLKPSRNGASCSRRNRNRFPITQSNKSIHFIGLFMMFGGCFCALTFSALPGRALVSLCEEASKHLIFECHLSGQRVNVFAVPALS